MKKRTSEEILQEQKEVKKRMEVLVEKVRKEHKRLRELQEELFGTIGNDFGNDSEYDTFETCDFYERGGAEA